MSWRAFQCVSRSLRCGTGVLVELVLPPVCAGCGVAGAWLCPKCAEYEPPIQATLACRRCGRPLDTPRDTCQRCDSWAGSIAGARSAYRFDGAVREMIHQLKYDGQHARSAWCGAAIGDVVAAANWHVDVVVPVPLHRSKERARGFNQARLIAHVFGSRSGLKVDDVLIRTRRTRSQTALDAEQRRHNVRGAFVARRRLDGQVVLLVDDVMTTGSTMVECALACRDVGASAVFAVTVATA